ncbi:MAG: OsmC family protein [Chloroflexota bacterium]
MIELDRISSTIEITLREGMRFDAVGIDGVSVALDADAAHGGTGAGFRPLELMLVSLGSCTGMDVISILRKKRQKVTRYLVEVSATQAEKHPHVFTSVAIRHIFQGEDLTDEAVRRAIELSETTYCPAFAMLSKATTIQSTYEIHAPPARE